MRVPYPRLASLPDKLSCAISKCVEVWRLREITIAPRLIGEQSSNEINMITRMHSFLGRQGEAAKCLKSDFRTLGGTISMVLECSVGIRTSREL
jgi:hypothetical protein